MEADIEEGEGVGICGGEPEVGLSGEQLGVLVCGFCGFSPGLDEDSVHKFMFGDLVNGGGIEKQFSVFCRGKYFDIVSVDGC